MFLCNNKKQTLTNFFWTQQLVSQRSLATHSVWSRQAVTFTLVESINCYLCPYQDSIPTVETVSKFTPTTIKR